MLARLIGPMLAIGLAACSSEPVPDPVAQALAATPAGQVGLYVFADKVVAVNHTTQSVDACVVVLDEAIRGELGALAAGATVTVMRTRFQPYLEADDFYARGKKRSRIDCVSPTGPVSVAIGGQREQRVVVPTKR